MYSETARLCAETSIRKLEHCNRKLHGCIRKLGYLRKVELWKLDGCLWKLKENLSHFKYNKIGTGQGGKLKSLQIQQDWHRQREKIEVISKHDLFGSHFKYNKIGTGHWGKFKSSYSTTYLAVISNTTINKIGKGQGENLSHFKYNKIGTGI